MTKRANEYILLKGGKMQVQVNIQDKIWDEFLKLGMKKNDIDKITEEALTKHIKQLRSYKQLLELEGKVKWQGDLDEMRRSRI